MIVHYKELKVGDVFKDKNLEIYLVEYVGKHGIGTIVASTSKYRAFSFFGTAKVNRIASGASLSITNIDDLKHHYPEYFL